MLHLITEQSEDKCIYKRIYLPYTVGVNNIFSQKEIEIAKRSTSFEREYNLKFLGLVGNVFLPEKIDDAIRLTRTGRQNCDKGIDVLQSTNKAHKMIVPYYNYNTDV